MAKKEEKKREEKRIKIAHVFLRSSKSFKKEERLILKSKSRIRISHHIYTYPPYSTHMHILV